MSRKFNVAIKAEPPLPTPDAEVCAMLQQAIALQQQSRYEEAIARYSDILRINPVHFDAVHMLGVIADQTGNHQLAVDLIAQAIAINPNNAEAYFNRGNALKALNQLEAAIDSYDKTIALNRRHASAYNNRGIALQGLDRRDEAIASYDAAICVKRDHFDAHYNRGVALQELNQLEAAVASYDKAIALNPTHAGAYNNRGNTLKDLQQFEAAVESYNKAISLQPNNPLSYCNRGNALEDLGQLDAAIASYDRAIALKPDFAEAYINRGLTLKGMNRTAEAIESLEKAISLKPKFTDAHHKYGNTLRELGRLDDARNAYCKAIELDPANCAAYFDLANSWKFNTGDRYLDAMEKLLPTTTGSGHMHLDFALGKAYADIKDYRRSFAHLLAGNTAKRAKISYDEASQLATFDRIEQVFTPELIAAKAGSGEPSTRPIFVLGMPRSGTTLVEQLLASHPAVCGAGELTTLNDVILTVHDRDDRTIPYPEFIPPIDHAGLGAIGADYVRRLAALAPDGEYVTNKMPANFIFVGLIHLVLPNSVIIHTMRNPVDTCISCFSKLFNVGQNFTYDLSELGRYYTRYHRLMDHWRRVLPPNRMLDVRYEEVVDDLEGQARRILAHCGLPWDERCLAFHQTDRLVRTASVTQVRQPIYKTAVNRWRVYENELAPLLNALGSQAEQG